MGTLWKFSLPCSALQRTGHQHTQQYRCHRCLNLVEIVAQINLTLPPSFAGRLTPQLLQVFRTLPVERLSLSSDTDHSDRVRGVANDSLLPTLSLPFSFTFLRDLDLSGSPLSSSSLLHLHDLPLETLNLANTGITLLGITHLIPLRVTLRELSVANNSKIDDSSIATIGLLTLLRCLDLRETAVSFLSLRLLAVRSPLAQPALVTIHPPSRVAASIVGLLFRDVTSRSSPD